MKKSILLLSSFIALNTIAQIPGTPEAGYEFTNGSYTATFGAGDLTSTTWGTPTTPTTDRFGDVNDAAYIAKESTGFITSSTNQFSTTLSFWINYSATAAGTTSRKVLQMYNASGYGYRLEVWGNDLWVLGKANASGSYFVDGSTDVTAPILDSQWHHIVITTNRASLYGTNDAIKVEFYVDNVKKSSSNYLFEYGTNKPALTEFIKSATFKVRPGNGFAGNLDDIYFYNSKLSTTEITALFNDSPSSAIATNDKSADVSAFPNPTVGKMTFQSDEKIESIAIFDLTGKQVASFRNTKTIDITNLSKGIYTAKIQLEKGKYAIKKIVKK